VTSDALRRLAALPAVSLVSAPTPVEDMPRLRAALGRDVPRLLVKRDDAIPLGFGGNKVRKLELVAAEAKARGADTLITVGGVQSNHMRATAATAARLGLRCVLVANGTRPESPRANALLDGLLGAEIHYVGTREERAPRMHALAERLRAEGRVPFEVPLGASTPIGAAAFARAVGELLEQLPSAPDVIVHACSSGGTQAGLVAGCALHGVATRVIGVSADDPAPAISATIRKIVTGLGALLAIDGDELARRAQFEVDDGFVGDGYGIPSDASREAQSLAARTEALFVDHTYTAKAFAALVSYVRAKRFPPDQTILFWHTGGQVGLFA
jgi:1-aminocyclopropane-1-carboxylate deaminase/D-cysteine desulfhydrase-like pyridoxal-dependent ACC family enzyme